MACQDEAEEDLRVEVVVVDHYMSSPLPADALEKLPESPCYLRAREVPVVRIFGATPAGQKAVVHVHGIFPYFYFRAENDEDFEDPERLRELLPRLAKGIEAANAAKQQNRRNAGKSVFRGKSSKIIAKMLIVQGTPFYGYHPQPKLFVQIFLYNPRVVTSVVQLLESGCIAERKFQPYEAHVPFLLQVFADYNIEGMNSVVLSNAKFRFPLPVSQDHLQQNQDAGEFKHILLSTVPSACVNGQTEDTSPITGRFSPVPQVQDAWFSRQSSCALEVDVAAASILNPRRFTAQQQAAQATGEMRNVPSLAAIWEEEKQRRIQNGERGTPTFSLSLERKANTPGNITASASPAQSASSLLSQSFFKQKMQDSVDTILEELQKKVDLHSTPTDSPGVGGSLSVSAVISCGNSISTQSAFSYSQAEFEADSNGDSNKNSAEEDEAIVNILLAMQQKSDQRENSWWNITERESHPAASPLSELGSPRVIISTPLKRQRQSTSTSRKIDFGTSPEDLPLVADIEDLLPPRPRDPTPLTPEEESVAVNIPLSLTPHPQPRGSSPKVPIPASGKNRLWIFQPDPPTLDDMQSSSSIVGVNPVQYQPAYYSNPVDIPDKTMVFGGKEFAFAPQGTDHLPQFDTSDVRQLLDPSGSNTSWCKLSDLTKAAPHIRCEQVRRLRMPARLPPEVSVVESWIANQSAKATPNKTRRKRGRPSLTPTPSLSSKLRSSSILSNVTILSVEIFAASQGHILPNPLHDPVNVIGFSVEAQEGPAEAKAKERGFILWMPGDSKPAPENVGLFVDSSDISVRIATDERDLLHSFEDVVKRWDPDFLTGFEVQKASVGYLIDRASQLDINLIQSLSRLPSAPIDPRNIAAHQDQDEGDSENPQASIGTTWGVNKASGLWIHGRYILNLWRMARSELKLSRYALEDVVWAVLKRTHPVYSDEQLSTWFCEGGQLRWNVIRYCLEQATLNLQLISKMQLITRTSEMARLFGIDFYSVLSRGSQYRVEAVMLRVTKRKNFLLVSPSRTQVARQAPMECIPLVMEPHSSFYSDPVVVLDFQSLYPSLIIGYNLCYSSLMGRLKDGLNPELESALGVVDFMPNAPGLLQCKGNLIIAPNGTLFCPKSYRHGVLPLILDEILSTRIMVKKSMKSAKESNQERLEKVLHARQLALKMLSNVTYGYTAAGFSGRMPCAQLADAIVQTGRCTLEAAVRLIEERSNWNAKVVYGDTDSVFVMLKGRSKEDAFRVGQEIADAVTASNPKPVTLKLEKVYMGCVLVSKKRYVGYKYESPTQEVGVIESKGLETVRRDSCGVVQNAMQSSLQVLFTTSDLSEVKAGLEKYWLQIMENRVQLKEFVFAKEVRLGTYSNGSAPPAALVSMKAMKKDPRAEPRYAERVPYVVVNGPPGVRLMDLVISPDEFFDQRMHYSINYHYYIDKQIIPSLERVFLLAGANIRSWYANLPRSSVKARNHVVDTPSKKRLFDRNARSIDSFYKSKHCRLCGSIGNKTLCENCSANPQQSLLAIHAAASRHEQAMATLKLACITCGGRESFASCCNFSCRVWNHKKLIEADKATLMFSDRQDE